MEQDTICAFDALYTNQQIQMLKLAMPLLPSVYRSFLAIYIKFLELQYTMQTAKQIRFSTDGNYNDTSMNFSTLDQYFCNIMPYVSDEEKGKIQKIKNMFQTMEQFKQMQPILDMMAQANDDSSSDSNQMDILKSFLSEEQLFMFDMFNNSMT
ncbi:MAG: hypothetical protein IJZ44_00090 [Lachnospiraceae bacterium]|nr:hypothetical protein [Lachnospiraceae bacterium]